MLSQTVWKWRRRKAVGGKGWLTELINQSVTGVFVVQPLALLGSAKYDSEQEEANLLILQQSYTYLNSDNNENPYDLDPI